MFSMKRLIIFGLALTFSHYSYSQNKCESNAFIINSSSQAGNHCDFYRDLDRANRSLETFSCKTTYANVVNHSPDLDCTNSFKEDWEKNKKFDFESGVKKPNDLFISGKEHSFENSALKKDMLAKAAENPNAPFLLYFTDHGGKEGNYYDIRQAGDSTISFGDTTLSFDEYWKFIGQIQETRKGQNLVMMHDHCFSEGMLKGFVKGVDKKNKTLDIVPGVCGAAAATESEFSYADESIMKYVDRMNLNTYRSKDQDHDNKINLSEMFDAYEYGYNSQSTPIKSSDIFLKSYLSHFQPSGYKMLFQYKDLSTGITTNLDAAFDECTVSSDPLKNPPFDEVTKASLEILTKDLSNNYLKFLNPSTDNKANYYNGAGFKEGLASYEQIETELKQVQNVLIKTNEEMHKLENNYFERLKALWSAKNNSEMKRLEGDYKSKMEQGLLEEAIVAQSQLSTMEQAFNKWVNDNPTIVDSTYEKEFKPQHDLLKVKWQKTQKQASGIRRLKKTVDALNGLNVLAQRKDFTGLKNLMNILECEKTELMNL